MASVRKREWEHNGSKKSAWVVTYTDPTTGKRPTKTFTKKKDADAYRLKVESEIEAGAHIALKSTATVASTARLYQNSLEDQVRDGRKALGTLRKEECYLRGHIIPEFGNVRLTDLSSGAVDQWVGKLRATTLRPASIKQLLRCLSRVIDFGLRRGMVIKNVAKEVGSWAENRGGKQVPIRTFTSDEVRTLLRTLQGKRVGWTRRSECLMRVACYLAAFCGLRLGEVMGLTWEHVDFDAKLIRIRHSLDAWDNLKSPKTGAGVRDVPMPSIVADELRAWKAFYSANPRNIIIRARPGTKLTTASFHRSYWQKALRDAGLGPTETGRRFHFHALRHFAASAMIEHNVPLADVADLLGHKSFDVTLQVYAHPMMGKDVRRVAVQGIADSLFVPAATTARQELLTA